MTSQQAARLCTVLALAAFIGFGGGALYAYSESQAYAEIASSMTKHGTYMTSPKLWGETVAARWDYARIAKWCLAAALGIPLLIGASFFAGRWVSNGSLK